MLKTPQKRQKLPNWRLLKRGKKLWKERDVTLAPRNVECEDIRIIPANKSSPTISFVVGLKRLNFGLNYSFKPGWILCTSSTQFEATIENCVRLAFSWRLCETWKMVLKPFYWDMEWHWWWCLHNGKHSWSRRWRHQPSVCLTWLSAPLCTFNATPPKVLFEDQRDMVFRGVDIDVLLNSFERYRCVHWCKSHCIAAIGKGVWPRRCNGCLSSLVNVHNSSFSCLSFLVNVPLSSNSFSIP